MFPFWISLGGGDSQVWLLHQTHKIEWLKKPKEFSSIFIHIFVHSPTPQKHGFRAYGGLRVALLWSSSWQTFQRQKPILCDGQRNFQSHISKANFKQPSGEWKSAVDIYIYMHIIPIFRFNHIFFAWIFPIFWAVPGSTSKTLRAFAHSSVRPVDTVDVRARGRHRRALTWIEWRGLNHGLFPWNPF